MLFGGDTQRRRRPELYLSVTFTEESEEPRDVLLLHLGRREHLGDECARVPVLGHSAIRLQSSWSSDHRLGNSQHSLDSRRQFGRSGGPDVFVTPSQTTKWVQFPAERKRLQVAPCSSSNRATRGVSSVGYAVRTYQA